MAVFLEHAQAAPFPQPQPVFLRRQSRVTTKQAAMPTITKMMTYSNMSFP
jgi:hypothetical protein